MTERDTGSGWRPLSAPTRSASAGLRELGLNRASGGAQSLPAFIRLARTHALHAAGDAAVAIALAGSLFFSIDPSAARSRVFLYLAVTLLPFALVGPLIGPALDRMKGGRRLMIILTLAGRAFVMLLMIPNIDSLWLFPIAFSQLVLGKTYSVAKAATVPSTVVSDDELVDKNSRLAVLSAVAGFVAMVPAVLLQRFLGSTATLTYAFVIYAIGIAAAFQLPRVVVDDPEIPQDELLLRSSGVRLAASAMSVLRGVVGFMFFMLAFAFRGGTDELDSSGTGFATGAAIRNAIGFELDTTGEPAWKLGVVLSFWGIGIFLGNLFASRARQRYDEENMILGALGSVLAGAVVAAFAGGLNGALLLALIVGAAPSIAKLAFDSLVQRDAPGANHGAAFGRFETRFQMAWVLGAIIPVLLKIPLILGFLIVAIAALFASLTYFLGFRNVRDQSVSAAVSQTGPPDAPASADGPAPHRPAPSRPTPAESADQGVATQTGRRRRITRSSRRVEPPPDAALWPAEVTPPHLRPTEAVPRVSAADPYAEAFSDAPIEAPDWLTPDDDIDDGFDDLRTPRWIDQDDGTDEDPAKDGYTF